ncbi:hypothetical protein PG984_003413 [Apiospora sp. TS-2023a]
MVDLVPYTPRMSQLESLPDELILKIISALGFAGFYCISQCSRRLKNICEDRIFETFNDNKDILAQAKMDRQEWQVQLRSQHQMHAMRTLFQTSQLAIRERTIWRLSRLLRKDLFCDECFEFRYQLQFLLNSRRLLDRRSCVVCVKYHGTMLFPTHPDTGKLGRVCLAHSGFVRLCPHQTFGWRAIARGHASWRAERPRRAVGRRHIHCDACDSTSKTASGTGVYYDKDGAMLLMYERRLPDVLDIRKGSVIGSSYLNTVREFCKVAEYQYICPHIQLDNPHLVERLFRAIPGFWSYHTGPTRPQTDEDECDLSGYVFKCGSCNCFVQLSLVRESCPNPDDPEKLSLVLQSWQRVVVADTPVETPGESFLTKLDPASYGHVNIRSPSSRCITWCDTPDCATSRLGRREAKILEAAWDIDGIDG